MIAASFHGVTHPVRADGLTLCGRRPLFLFEDGPKITCRRCLYLQAVMSPKKVASVA